MEIPGYKAFISYRHQSPDQEIAKQLHTMIETYRIPSSLKKSLRINKMGRVFRDEEELPLSTDLGADIRTALAQSEWLIVLCSPSYLESKWCKAELDYYISLGRRDHILAILVNGDPNESFPEQLRFMEVNGHTVQVEPLAGDVRAENTAAALKKLKTEKLRVLAPMLGVTYDTLRQRARRRRTRIIAATVAACFALLTGFLGYALVKNLQIAEQRDIAEEQRIIAEEQRNLAAEQRDIAVDNQMKLLIEQANISTDNGDKLPAALRLTEAARLRESAGTGNDVQLKAALEYALYNSPFDTILTIDNDNRQFDSLVFSNNNKYLLGITNLNSACLISAETGEILFTVSRRDVGQLSGVGFTKDDRYFYIVDDWYGYITLYDVETGELYREYDGSGEYVWNIGGNVIPMSGDRLMIVKDKIVILWNYVKGTEEEILPVMTDGPFDGYLQPGYPQPFDIAVSQDESVVVIGSHGYGVGMKIMSLDGRELVALDYDTERGYPQIMFSGDGRYVAAGSGNQYFIWDAATGRQLLRGEASEEYTGDLYILINYDGSVLLLMSSDYLGAVDTADGNVLWEKHANSNIVTEASISPDGRYLCAAGGISGIFDIRTGELLCNRSATAFSSDSSKVLCDTYSNDPELLVTPVASTSYLVDSFDRKLCETPRFTDPKVNIQLNLQHFCSELYSTPPESTNRQSLIYTSPDLRYAAQTHYDGFIEVFDISDPGNPVEISCMAEHIWESVTDLVFSGDLMASCGGFDPRCVITDLSSGHILHVLMGTEYTHGCEFSPDGSKIIIACGYNVDTAYVYAVETGSLLYTFHAPEGRMITDIGFTEDGSLAVALLGDNSAVVGELCQTLEELMEKAGFREIGGFLGHHN